ncbi:rhodanese-like domain-containing protein [Microbacterium immunditiarum]|uniref:Rhodanese-related sulfurtransferase n=1 Tax=Microbacterium immunditiarum TaxID=337480 RepID=A0A7Y9GRU7_9MICO|nr:rhodanese-like domain-containing protein [Microbacterium immunditiarum]NYE21559.1 rhodanese-related sulfurtransferase [Microbacterium immunditiarum]
MLRRSLRGAALVAAIALPLTVTGCASAPASSIAIGEDTVVVDVRTAGEYAGGHLETAINIDLRSPEFDSAISELDTDVDYVVYCQSGNRSAQAVAAMQAAGLDVHDAGGISDAARSTGLPIVR